MPTYRLTCAACSKEFEASRVDAVTCSASCRAVAARTRKLAARKAAVARLVAAIPPQANRDWIDRAVTDALS